MQSGLWSGQNKSLKVAVLVAF